MLWIHVDGGVLVTSNNKIREKLKLKLTEKMKLRWDEDINSIVGIEIKREGNGFILKQPRLIKKLVQATDSQPLPEIKLESSPASLPIGNRDDTILGTGYMNRHNVRCKLLSEICNEHPTQSLEGTQTSGGLHKYNQTSNLKSQSGQHKEEYGGLH
ncbi:hypothetical protein O181_031949 [Austropuccinia psidii MF-1]|uniref:Uncharacterized protein n=1 Tax=Austropuccinia psidii MF-1 TaxID=1389203 RepID=A0A9Q3H729_9BASI|nr:hypothetical protein [Austropuccinia psidii MF-1]